MPRFNANLSFLFTEYSWERRFDVAAAAGFNAVEINAPAPYQFSPMELKRRLADSGLACVALVAPLGDRQDEATGCASHPGRSQCFEDLMKEALDYASIAKAKVIHPLAGCVPKDVTLAEANAVYRENIGRAADMARPLGVAIGLEPVWSGRFPGYFLTRTDQAVDIAASLGRDNVGLIYDFYHAQMEEGQLSATLARALPSILHVQVANPPGRHEPGVGEIDCGYLFSQLDAAGYDGWIGCEYHPSAGDTIHSLAWAKEWGVRPRAESWAEA